MTLVRYAAYGSNLAPARLQARVGSIETLGTALLNDWSLDFSKRGADGSGKCDLKPGQGSTAHVAVYEISVAARETLDRIEGVGFGYRLEQIDIGEFGQCCIYLAEPGYVDPKLIPFDWYHALVLSGAVFHGFPDAYVAQIRAVRAKPDTDQRRRSDNLAQCPKVPLQD